MSEEECRTILASIALAPNTIEPTYQVSGGERPHGELQIVASRPVEEHEQSLPSLEPDTIDNLAQPKACNLVVMVGGSYRMEVGKGLVYPYQSLLDNVQIEASTYAVVKVDMVRENMKNMKLEMPPDDTMLTMCDAITRRIQWRTSIDVDPSTIASASTTTS
jgi:hypothetical protein